jgi:hypothetical protein
MSDVYQLRSKKIMAVRNGFYPAAQGAPRLEGGENHFSLLIEGQSIVMSETALNKLFEPFVIEKEKEINIEPKEVENGKPERIDESENRTAKRGRPRKSGK